MMDYSDAYPTHQEIRDEPVFPTVKERAAEAHRKNLAVGEPWTFIAKDDEEAAVYASKTAGGRMSVWWSTGEPGRLFLITRVHARSLETTFLGFQCMPGSFLTVDEMPTVAADHGALS